MWGRVLWGKILETKIGGIVMAYCFCDICDYKDECKYYRKVVVCPYIKTEE